MYAIGVALQENGWTLRSGHAQGADTAFEKGAGVKKEIFIAKDAANDHDAMALAERFHPAWHRCSRFAKALHARNGYILLGRDLQTPVKFVVCWTPDGKASGGTGQALRIAADPAYKIPVFNLYDPLALDKLRDFIPETVW
jgi:hypothetical protein